METLFLLSLVPLVTLPCLWSGSLSIFGCSFWSLPILPFSPPVILATGRILMRRRAIADLKLSLSAAIRADFLDFLWLYFKFYLDFADNCTFSWRSWHIWPKRNSLAFLQIPEWRLESFNFSDFWWGTAVPAPIKQSGARMGLDRNQTFWLIP